MINDFLSRMADLTQVETTRLRSAPDGQSSETTGPSEHAAPLGGLRSARLMFRSGAQELRLRSSRVPADLYRARFDGATPQVRMRDGCVLVQYRGIPFDWRKRVATMSLNATIPWTIDVVGRVVQIEANLREIELTRFELTGGSDRIHLELGQPRGEVPVRIVGGAKTLRLERPAGTPVSLTIQGGAGRVVLDGKSLGRKGGETTVESRGWGASADRFRVEVVGGAKTIELVERQA